MESAAKTNWSKDTGGRDQAFSTIAFTDSSFSLKLFMETDTEGNDWHLDVTHNEIKPGKSLYQCRILGPLPNIFSAL